MITADDTMLLLSKCDSAKKTNTVKIISLLFAHRLLYDFMRLAWFYWPFCLKTLTPSENFVYNTPLFTKYLYIHVSENLRYLT